MVACETLFAEDTHSSGDVIGLSPRGMRHSLEYCADQRLAQLDMPNKYAASNPFDFMDAQEVGHFFERRVSVCQLGVQEEVAFDMTSRELRAQCQVIQGPGAERGHHRHPDIKRRSRLDENLAALEVQLGTAERQALDATVGTRYAKA